MVGLGIGEQNNLSLIVGLDCSSINIGYAYFKDGILWKCGVLKSFDVDRNGRQFELFSKLHELFNQNKPDMVVLENAIYISNFKTTQAISEVIGAAKIACQLFKIPFKTVQVTQWKKNVCGKGNLDKKGIMEYVKKTFTVDSNIEQDVADSICVCYNEVLNEREKLESPENTDNRIIKKAGRKRRIKDSGTA